MVVVTLCGGMVTLLCVRDQRYSRVPMASKGPDGTSVSGVTQIRRNISCPYCGRVNDTHSGWNKVPQPGDVGICWKCRGLAVLTPFGFLRKATEEELVELRDDPELRAALAAMSESYTPLQAVDLMRGYQTPRPGPADPQQAAGGDDRDPEEGHAT